MIKVMLVDDHDLVRTGIKRLLEDVSGISIVCEANSGEEALQLVRTTSPDVVLMDINMPGIGGLEATRKLIQSKPDLRIIVVTMHDDDLFPQRLLKAGAMGYVTKGAKVDEIVRAIHDVMANRRYITPEIAQQIALSQFDGEQGSPFDSLSERELQVLLMLMDGQTVSVISAKLCLSPKTVSTYRARLYSKLGVQNDIELARLALLHGIVENTSNLNT
ncbi:MAG: UvrY/SirA/GacA family response regulator transcription factor [Proteobacteria bacterium]|jgi:two-component system, NarL family, invasion response regulator UvrY|nr:UvrY/SirA/GacA family response regulator transcription factor [Pseudomonadota bacterium]